MTGGGDWLLLQELLERGDPEFVDRLRGVTDADALGRFAERWYADPSPNARRLLLAYLERPLNAYRHEALVKRLFKRAEAAGDDAVMARFLVAFDRSIRRVQQGRSRHGRRLRSGAGRRPSAWPPCGDPRDTTRSGIWQNGPMALVDSRSTGRWSEPYVTTPGGTTMPRGRDGLLIDFDDGADVLQEISAPDWVVRLKLDPARYRDTADPPEPIRREARALPPLLGPDAAVPAAPGLALFPSAGEGASRALRRGDLRGPGALRGRRRRQRAGADRQLGADPRPVPP